MAEPAVAAADAYRMCRRQLRYHGPTFWWASWLLPRTARADVSALYAFARYVDDIVDEPEWEPHRRATFDAVVARFRADFAQGSSTHPLIAAVVASAHRHQLGGEAFERFFAAMRRDLDGPPTFASRAELDTYMDGSAAVFGEMMLPVLAGRRDLAETAGELGRAFQLTNFLRDIAVDHERGRIYLDVDAPGGEVDAEIQRCRDHFAAAQPGIDALPWRSRWCVAVAAAW